MIRYIHVNHNYRAVTLYYTNGTDITITRADYDKFHAFVENCTKHCKLIRSRDNGWYTVFEM